MQVAIDLPNDFVQLKEPGKIIQELRLSYALRLFKASEVTLAKAAELAGLDLYDFMTACKQEKISVIDVTRDELLEELDGMRIS